MTDATQNSGIAPNEGQAMTGQEARDDEREAVIAEAKHILDSIGEGDWNRQDAIMAWLVDDLTRKHPEPEAPAQVAVSVQSRKAGKTQQMIDALLAQANERGIAVEILEPKHPEPEITDEALLRFLLAYYPEGSGNDALADWPVVLVTQARVALQAALRVPVGEGEQ